jgi:putative ABC transport system ATP-binding protein
VRVAAEQVLAQEAALAEVARITDLIFGLNAEAGTALVLVTHDPELASRTGLRLRLRGGIPVSE